MITIGLTGGIGAGKSAVSRILSSLGATVIDADRLGHEIYLPGKPAWQKLVDAFGQEIVAADGTIDRKELGRRVFSDPSAIAHLNAILHPMMADQMRDRIAGLRAGGLRAPIVVEAAVLLEAGWDRIVDEVWVVTAPKALAIERVIADRGLAREEVERRIGSQLGEAERRRAADCVIENAGSLGQLDSEVRRAWRERVASRPS